MTNAPEYILEELCNTLQRDKTRMTTDGVEVYWTKDPEDPTRGILIWNEKNNPTEFFIVTVQRGKVEVA